MAFHSEGAARIRHYNRSMEHCREAGYPQGLATALVHRGLEWRERGEYRRALRDLEDGLAIARWKNMGARRQLAAFIQEVKVLMKTNKDLGR